MNQASLYSRINQQARRDVELVLKKYGQVIKWRKDGHDALIDIGSGSGDVLMDFVYPLMPANFKQLVGTDLTEKMVNYSSDCYAKYERVRFEVLDIGADKVPEHLRGEFDHVTSFYCLHWVQNQRKMLENVWDLLRRDGGDCLFVFLGTQFLYDIYENMSQLSKWSNYLADYKKFVSPYHESPDVAQEFRQLLQEAGFVDCSVEARNDTYLYDSLKHIRNLYRAICPFFDRIPETLHEEFLDDFIHTMVNLNLRQKKENSDEFDWISTYKLVVVYARKPSG